MAEENIIRISGETDGGIYSKGDTCLLINPFDTFHLFRLYTNWESDNRVPLNLSESGQKLYLIFKNSKTEIRVPEYTNSESNYTTDKSNGEVLFKISKEIVGNILSIGSNTFYITRTYEYRNEDGTISTSPSEEVLYTGRWADENRWTNESLTSSIKSLQKQLATATSEIASLTKAAADYRLRMETMTEENETLKKRVEGLESEVEELNGELSEYRNSNEFTSVVISDNATYQYYKDETEVDENGNPLLNQINSIGAIQANIAGPLNITKTTDIPMTEAQMSNLVKNSNLNNL